MTDIALLYRSNAQSRVLEHALFSAGLAYRVYGGLRFFERQEIKHALAYLRLVANPEDDGALLRVVNFPTRGIGARSLEVLQETGARAGHEPLADGVLGTARWQGRHIHRCVRPVDRRSAPVGDRAAARRDRRDRRVEGSTLKDHYRTEKEGAERVENLDELINAPRRRSVPRRSTTHPRRTAGPWIPTIPWRC